MQPREQTQPRNKGITIRSIPKQKNQTIQQNQTKKNLKINPKIRKTNQREKWE